MAKLTRVFQKQFAGTSGFHQTSQFGSLANSTPNFTLDPAVIQALSEFDSGWYDAVLGENSPAIQDMNAIFFLAYYQLRYLFQEGVSEWDATTTYYIGSIAKDVNGSQYLSTLDNNTNNALNVTGWFPIGTVGLPLVTVGNVTMPANLRVGSPSPIVLAASSTMNVPSTSVVIVPDSVIVPTGCSLIVAAGGSVRVI